MDSDDGEATRPAYAAPALTKGLDILELLADRGVPMRLTDVADALGRSKSELFRMLIALEARGYIEREPGTDGFRLTDRLFQLGLHTPRARDLVSTALPEMTALAARSGQSPHLVVVHRGRTAVVAAVPSGADVSFTLNLGFSRIAIDSTSGNVVLAFQAAETRAAMIAESEAVGPVPPDLPATLAAIAARGYELHESRDFPGITDICCPVFGPGGWALASIILPYVNRYDRDTKDAALALLREACARISAALGATPSGNGSWEPSWT